MTKVLLSFYTYTLFVVLMIFAFLTAFPVFLLSHLWSPVPRKYFQKIVQQYFRLFYFLMPNIRDIKVSNKKNLNRYHPCIYIPSHQSTLDYTLLATLIDDYVTPSNHFISDYPLFFGIPRYALGVYYIPKGDLAQASTGYENLKSALRRRSCVIIFPEGTRNPSSVLKRFKGGAFRLAVEERVPLIPVLINGTGSIVTKGSNITKTLEKKDIYITLLDPVYPQKDETYLSLKKRVRDMMQNTIEEDLKYPKQESAV